MREPATTLTDYLLALLALIPLRLARMHSGNRSLGALMFFSGFAAAAIFGGTWHGFFSDGASPAERVIWWLTQVFTGIAASGLAVIGLERFGWRNSRAEALNGDAGAMSRVVANDRGHVAGRMTACPRSNWHCASWAPRCSRC